MTTTRRTLLLGAAGAAAAALPLGPMTAHAAGPGAKPDTPYVPRLPRPGGRYPVGRVDLHVKDTSRPDPWKPEVPFRELMLSLWYPAYRAAGRDRATWVSPLMGELINEANQNPPPGTVDWSAVKAHSRMEAPVRRGGFPVLVYGPGHFQPRHMWTCQAEELASHGYAVITVDHTYESSVEFPGGRFVEGQQGSMPDDPIPWLLKTIRTWVDDSVTALSALGTIAAGGNPDVGDRPLPAGLGEALDLSRIGAFGAGAGSGLGAMQLAYDDDRVQAVYSGDSLLSFPVGDDREPIVTFHTDGLRQPLMIMRPTSEYQEACPFYDSFFERCDGPKWELELIDSGGSSQNDLQALLPDAARALGLPDDEFADTLGTIEVRDAITAARAYARAFFDRQLRDRDGDLLDGPHPRYPQVRFAR